MLFQILTEDEGELAVANFDSNKRSLLRFFKNAKRLQGAQPKIKFDENCWDVKNKTLESWVTSVTPYLISNLSREVTEHFN